MDSRTLSLAEARRLAVASQMFGARAARPGVAQLRELAARVHAFQIDSVNVLARAHYVAPFARLGPYPVTMLDELAYKTRELFEYWGHAACLMPVSLYPLLRYRMDKHGEWTRQYMRSRRGAYMAEAYAEVQERGSLAAAELSSPGKRSGNWWGWSSGKRALEHLYDAGLLAISGRRGFERLYDLAERVIPAAAREAPVPPREQAMKELIVLAAKAQGIGTADDLASYFYVDGWRDRRGPEPWWARASRARARRTAPVVGRLVAELVEEGRLLPVRVEGWKAPAYLQSEARVPQSVAARAFVTPFDSLVWHRPRLQRLFGMKYTIEIYTPVAKRIYGYYVCPFLLGETIVARADLKADRSRGALVVHSVHLEPRQQARRVLPELAAGLRELRSWLGLEHIQVARPAELRRLLNRR
ncbi:MAG TPA: crosslink repair DNA glycosylase YcaQ family protein [Burkholderiales bacterium]|nr:crosslink repair DNA glycosylase YcaQ family protein [Burkholderiales bacterium]